MTSINSVHLEVPDPTVVDAFYRDALGLGDLVRLRASESQSTGFRGFTLSLVVSQPATVDAFVRAAVDAGATSLKPAVKQFWGGYSGVVQAPDGTICKIATESKKNTGPATRQIDGTVLLLGGLYRRRALAMDANVSSDGSGSHRLVICSDAGSFSDPDGFAWEAG